MHADSVLSLRQIAKVKGDFSGGKKQGALRDIAERSSGFYRHSLFDCHIDGGRAFFSLLYVKGDAIAFIQRSETGRLDA